MPNGPVLLNKVSFSYRPRAECTGCDRTWQSSRHTREDAKRHAKTFDHEVVVISETRDHYSPKENSDYQPTGQRTTGY